MMKRPPLTLSLRATQSFKFKRLAEIFQADSQEALWHAALQPRVTSRALLGARICQLHGRELGGGGGWTCPCFDVVWAAF